MDFHLSQAPKSASEEQCSARNGSLWGGGHVSRGRALQKQGGHLFAWRIYLPREMILTTLRSLHCLIIRVSPYRTLNTSV